MIDIKFYLIAIDNMSAASQQLAGILLSCLQIIDFSKFANFDKLKNASKAQLIAFLVKKADQRKREQVEWTKYLTQEKKDLDFLV